MSELEDSADRLAGDVAGLSERVDKLSLSLDQLGRRTSRTERLTTRNALVAALLVAALLIVGWVAYGQQQTANRLGDVTQLSLCPVFKLVLGGYDPQSRPAGDARAQYEQQFSVMRDAYARLQCTGELVPPRTSP